MKVRNLKLVKLFVATMVFVAHAPSTFAMGCGDSFGEYYVEPTPVQFKVRGLQVASVTDETKSTGTTLFYFPNGAYVNFDSRGGSVASVETTLFSEGSYSNQIDGIILSGGSTMGLAASDGVREAIYEQRAGKASQFDAIPSVPGAVVYDFGGRIAPYNKQLLYPTRELGKTLMDHLSPDTFQMGRAGAGITTTVNKIGVPRWGGQGISSFDFSYQGQQYHLMTAVVLNSGGDIIKADESFSAEFSPIGSYKKKDFSHDVPHGGRQNTTLSVVITDFPLDRGQLKRIAIMAHSSMTREIYPFHGSTDGDIMFVASTGGDQNLGGEEIDGFLGIHAAKSMREAIYSSVAASNPTIKGKK